MMMPRLVLQPASLPNHQSFVTRPLVGSWAGRDEELPLVAVATGHADGAFILAPREGSKAQVEALVEPPARARRSRRVAVRDGDGEQRHRRSLDGCPLLVPDAMRAAAKRLRSDTILACVPKRGWIMAAAGTLGNFRASMPLHQAAEGIASRGGKHTLSGSLVFQVTDGTVTGTESLRGSSGSISLQKPDPAAWHAGS